MRIPNRRRQLLLLPVFLVAACGGMSDPSAPGGALPTTIVENVDEKAAFPGQEGLSAREMLQVINNNPGVRGVVQIHVRDSGTAQLARAADPESIFREYDALVVSTAGMPQGLYRSEQKIALRIPGGTLDGIEVNYGDAPSFEQGETYFVFVQRGSRPETPAGEDNANVLTAINSGNVIPVEGNSLTFRGEVLTVEEFASILDEHPSRARG